MTKPTAEELMGRSLSAINYLMGLVEGMRIAAGSTDAEKHPPFIVKTEADLKAYFTGDHKGKD